MNKTRGVIGIDEVGRGCWAGPLVACAAILDEDKVSKIQDLWFLSDSKNLSRKIRIQADLLIRDLLLDYGLGWVTSEEIDEIGLTKAVRLAMQRAVYQINEDYSEIIIDGNYNYLLDNPRTKCQVKADATIPSVCAASILAKVARDNYLIEMSENYPEYGFDRHVGYGTKDHIAALAKFGPTKHHRMSFKPMQLYI